MRLHITCEAVPPQRNRQSFGPVNFARTGLRLRSPAMHFKSKGPLQMRRSQLRHFLRAIEKKEKLTIAASKIDDGRWVLEAKMSARWSLGAGSKDVSASPQHRRGRLLRIRAAISGRCLSCVRVATAFTDAFCAAGFA
eukprot:s1005_g27.t2